MKDITEVFNWYIMSGVDAICDETPMICIQKTSVMSDIETHNTKTIPTNYVEENNIRLATTELAQDVNKACSNAKEICRKANSLDELKDILNKFDGCSLKLTANSTVFGNGDPHAKIMIIGEAPGAEEDRYGKPFVGKSGQLLDKMLKSIEVEREKCFVSNILPWRPPGNRPPTDSEIAVCLPFVKRQIELVKPSILLLLGASSVNSILGIADTISHVRGHFLEYTCENEQKILTLASYHPAYLLRNPAQKAKSWSDLLRIKRKMTEC